MVGHVVPIRFSARDIFARSAAVFILMPVAAPDAPPVELVMSLFDLTPAEARVARGLAAGKTVDDLAGDNGVSPNTVRVQVRGVLEKTGCRRQTEVVALLGGISAVRLDPAGELKRAGRPRLNWPHIIKIDHARARGAVYAFAFARLGIFDRCAGRAHRGLGISSLVRSVLGNSIMINAIAARVMHAFPISRRHRIDLIQQRVLPLTRSAVVALVVGAATLISISPGAAQSQDCSAESSLKSVQAGGPVELAFRNASTERRRLYWIDPNGDRKFNGLIEGGNLLRQTTSTGHSWVVTDDAEKCLFAVTATAEPVTIDVGGVATAQLAPPPPGVQQPIAQAPVAAPPPPPVAQAAPQLPPPPVAAAPPPALARRKPPWPSCRRFPRSSNSSSAASIASRRAAMPPSRSTVRPPAPSTSPPSSRNGTAASGSSKPCRARPSCGSGTSGRRPTSPTSTANCARPRRSRTPTRRIGASSRWTAPRSSSSATARRIAS